ncbi:MAG: alpha/beta fold hydrolase [Chloroflexota bacterium]|nr:alpha/beta fold hydrolase [Chloroflexota bacterium]
MSQLNFTLMHLSRPPVEKSKGKAPGLLLLHGVGANEEDLMGLAPYLDPRFHIISARAPIEMGPGMYGWYWIQMLSDGSFLYSEEEARQSVEPLSDFVEEILDAYELDRERFYLVGFSQGAIQSCALLLTEPEKMAGIVAMSGRWPEPAEEERASDERLAGKPVLAVHGMYDPVIPIHYGRELKAKFEALPVDFTYQEFPMQHNVSEASLRLVSEWLTEQLDGEKER